MSTFAVINPATGETIREYGELTDAGLRSAIARADGAFRPWAALDVQKRAGLLRRVGDLHGERSNQLARIICREMGKPITQARGEVDFAARIYHFYSENADRFIADEAIELESGEGTAVIRRTPIGTLLGIMPWNFPYYQVARFAGPNLIVGNTALLKHSPQCPESSLALQAIFDDAGVPPGVYENIFATHEQVEWLIADVRVRGVSVTGSARAGAAVASIAGQHLKVVLELGGSDPFIVLGTDDMDATVAAAVSARLRNAGQACNAAKRFIVLEEYYDDFVAKFSEALSAVTPRDPSAHDTTLGPLSSTAAADRLEEQVRRAVANGARVLVGGGRRGNFFEPTLLEGISPGDEASHEEFFGPVAQVYKAGSEEEAIDLANETPYGLGSYVMTTDAAQAQRVAHRIEAGMVWVNLTGPPAPELPFGGVKGSGFGRELGALGADEFVNKKLIRTARESNG